MASQLVCLRDFEEEANKTLPTFANNFFRSGSDQEQTVNDNRQAYLRWRLMPRVMRGNAVRTMQTTALGFKVSAPIGIAPTAMQKLAHPDGECATARAAARHGIVYIMSTVATSTIEEIAEAAPTGNHWLQLYIYKDRQATVDIIRRAEAARFKALVVTVDTVALGRRLASERGSFTIPKLANVGDDAATTVPQEESPSGSSLVQYVQSMFDPTLTWNDIEWLKSITSLPIVVKGVLRPDDAELAVRHGAAAITVSNHGGRQLDGVLATIDALPGIVKQVAGRCEVFLDGGVTQGTDVLKALALGAKMVFVGRPTIWGLAHDGEQGVSNIIAILKMELDLAMALAGCRSVAEVDRTLVVHDSQVSRL